VKLLIDDAAERRRRSFNIRVNWLIIKTILDIYKTFDRLVISSEDNTSFLFDFAAEGDLYNFDSDDSSIIDRKYNYIDEIIQSYRHATHLTDAAWYGKIRLLTGFKYTEDDWVDEKSIDYLEVEQLSDEEQDQLYKDIIADPLNMQEQEYVGGDIPYEILTLESLTRLCIADVFNNKQKNSEFMVTIPEFVRVYKTKERAEFFNNKGMLKYFRYGRKFETLIRNLSWTGNHIKDL